MSHENHVQSACDDRTEFRVPCQRVSCRPTVAEHRACPYCFGSAKEVARGDYERFCDFWRSRDAVHFGFPETFGRYSAE